MFVAWLRVRGGWEATRFPVGERRASSDCVLRDLAYLLLPRESRSFPTTPFHVREKRTPVPSWTVSPLSNRYKYEALCIKPLRTLEQFIRSASSIINTDYCGSGFWNLPWQRGGGEWRDSCGNRVLGETPQGVSLRRLTALPRKASHSPQPHPLNKSLEIESSTILPFSLITIMDTLS